MRIKEQMTKKMRDSNIELLRIIAVMGVIVLHFNGAYGKGFEYVETGTLNDYVLRYLESIFIPAVNLFILISGYYLCNHHSRGIVKIVYLIIQVMIFGEFTYLLSVADGTNVFSLSSAISAAIPCNYYVILYGVLYLISPYFNIVMQRLTKEQLKIFLSLNFVLFSVWPIFIDVLQEVMRREFQGLNTIGLSGDQNGYTIVHFCLMYIIGAYIKTKNIEWSVGKSITVVGICSVSLTVWSIVLPQTAWAYCNPLVIIEAVAFFLLFKELHISNKYINVASKAVFTCFLFHGYFVQKLSVSRLVQANVIIMLAYIVLAMLGIYLVCYCAYYIYDFVEKHVIKRMFKRFEKLVINVKS